MKKTLLTLLCVTTSVVTSQAAIQILPDPSSATASSQFNASFAVTNLFDGSITAANVGTTTNQGNAYAGRGAGPHTVIYDMGSAMDVGGFFYANRAGNGTTTTDQVRMIEFWFGNGISGAADVVIGSPTDTSATNELTASNYGVLRAYDFGSNTSTQFVTMRLTGDGAFNPGGNELRLATHVVPEPSSFMLLGLSGLALFKRRRK